MCVLWGGGSHVFIWPTNVLFPRQARSLTKMQSAAGHPASSNNASGKWMGNATCKDLTDEVEVEWKVKQVHRVVDFAFPYYKTGHTDAAQQLPQGLGVGCTPRVGNVPGTGGRKAVLGRRWDIIDGENRLRHVAPMI